jgi:hypothetical protein
VRKPQCHPNRKHYAKGLCAACYTKKSRKKKEKREVKHEPVTVTHTHDVIRAVRNEEEDKMAEQHQHEKKAENGKQKADDKPVVVKSPAGETHGGQELGGDGVTPKAEWDKKYEEIKKKQDEHDEKRRQRAVEDAGVIQTTEKDKHAALMAAEERRYAAAAKLEKAEA